MKPSFVMVNKIRIRFTCNYFDDQSLFSLLLRQLRYYQYYSFLPVLDQSFEYLIVFNYTNRHYLPERTIAFIQEPSWSSDVKCNYLNRWVGKVHFHDRSLLHGLTANVIERISFLPYFSSLSIEELDHFSCVKKKRMSIIVSKHDDQHLYSFRQELLRKLLVSNLPIDIFGRGLSIDDRRYKGAPDEKYEGLFPYEFSVAIENSSEKNYVTEKISDCILTETVPIYLGAPNIGDLFDSRSFISLDERDPVGQIRRIFTSEDYQTYRPYLLQEKKRLMEEDFFRYLHEFFLRVPLSRKRPFDGIREQIYKFRYFR